MAPKANNKAALKEAKRRKQQQKSAAKQKKRSEPEEVDIDIILKELEEEERRQRSIKAQIIPSEQPSPRAHFTLTSLPSGELFFFGGEHYDGQKVRVYNESYKFSIDKKTWRRILSPETPKARCSHQAVFYNDAVYIFGGEFSTYYQFHHFRDLWKFDLKTNMWTKVTAERAADAPPARSGHRMVVWRNMAVVFGGFHDAARDTRYFNDLYVYIFSANRWRKIEFEPGAQLPDPRSGCVFAVVGDTIVMHGGFAKVRDTHKKVQGKTFMDTWLLDMKPLAKNPFTQIPEWTKIRNTGTPPSPRTGACCTVYKSAVWLFGGVADHDDGRAVIQSQFYNDLFVFDVPKRRWYHVVLRGDKMKRSRDVGQHPSHFVKNDNTSVADDAESGCVSRDSSEDEAWQHSFAYFDSKGRLVKVKISDLQGETRAAPEDAARGTSELSAVALGDLSCDHGVAKIEDPVKLTTSVYSEQAIFHSTLDTPTTASTNSDTANTGGLNSAARDNDELGLGEFCSAPVPSCVPTKVFLSSHDSAAATETAMRSKQVSFFSDNTPLPRLHGVLITKGNWLVLMGGIYEFGNQEVTLDDCWTLNLNRRDRWIRILEGTMHEREWKGVDSEDSESSSESETDSECSRSSDEMSSDTSTDSDFSSSSSDSGYEDEKHGEPKSTGRKIRAATVREETEQLREEYNLNDSNITPKEKESLKEFFARTKEYWTSVASDGVAGKKDASRAAFVAAQKRFEELTPVLQKLQKLHLRGDESGTFRTSSNMRHVAGVSKNKRK